jgi:hypothetical protein
MTEPLTADEKLWALRKAANSMVVRRADGRSALRPVLRTSNYPRPWNMSWVRWELTGAMICQSSTREIASRYGLLMTCRTGILRRRCASSLPDHGLLSLRNRRSVGEAEKTVLKDNCCRHKVTI